MSYDETMSAIDEALDDSWEWGGDAARWHPGLEHETALTGRRIRITTDVGDDAISARAEWFTPVADISEYQRLVDQMVGALAEQYSMRLDLLLRPPARLPEVFIPAEPPRFTGREPDVLVFDETLHWTEANPAWEGVVEQIRQRAEQPGSRCITVTTAGE